MPQQFELQVCRAILGRLPTGMLHTTSPEPCRGPEVSPESVCRQWWTKCCRRGCSASSQCGRSHCTTLRAGDDVIGLKIDRIRVVKAAFGCSKERTPTILIRHAGHALRGFRPANWATKVANRTWPSAAG
jgi:hypothetical protein